MFEYCKICGNSFDDKRDKKQHKNYHIRLASGAQPKAVREFSKAFGFAVAHSDGGMPSAAHYHDDNEVGKLTVLYAYWSRARDYGIPIEQFDEYMKAHREFVDILVDDRANRLGEGHNLIRPWAKYNG